MRRHVTYRPDGKIQSEIPVCQSCAEKLRNGSATQQPTKKPTTKRIYAPTYEEPIFGG